jgi:dihydroorotate dehydrogenase (fumarate)
MHRQWSHDDFFHSIFFKFLRKIFGLLLKVFLLSGKKKKNCRYCMKMSAVDLSVRALGLAFANPFMNASGVSGSTAPELAAMLASTSGAVVTKSCTCEFRQGNPEPRIYSAPTQGYSINSMGLPNLGFDFYLDYARNFCGSKPLFFSMAGMTLEDNVDMARRLCPVALEKGVMLELNLSCPNLANKPQVAYDFESARKYIAAVSAVYTAPLGVKLPPYFDIVHFDEIALILNAFPNVKFVTCVNSLGNGLMIDIDTEKVLIKPKAGFGGIGGKWILPTALANVRALSERCPDKMVIGCGGVVSGEEAFMHILCGATLVQIGTTLWDEGPGAFTRIQQELVAIMEKKGYTSVDQFRGKVKVID